MRKADSRRLASKRGRRASAQMQSLEPRRLLAGVLVQDVNPGTQDGKPSIYKNVVQLSNGVVLYYGYSATMSETLGDSLMRSDGTPQGTFPLKDLYAPSTNSYSATLLTVYHDKAYFAFNDLTSARLWKTDGTVAGTERVYSDALDLSTFDPMTVYNDQLYFFANQTLYRTDGTNAGTVAVKTGFNGSFSPAYMQMNGVLYFAAATSATGGELWRTDGTTAGTSIVRDLNPAGDGLSSSTTFGVFNNELYFAGNANGGTGLELFKSDGTSAGTVLVKDVNSGSSSSTPGQFVVCNNLLLFQGTGSGRDLYATDGTPGGTQLVADLGTGTFVLGEPVTLGTNAYFINNLKLWRTDGTGGGTAQVAPADSYSLASANGLLFYKYNNQVMRSDGTGVGTFALATTSFDGSEVMAAGNRAYAFAIDAAHGKELWRFDGSVNGSVFFADANLLNASSNADPGDVMIVSGANTFMSGARADVGIELTTIGTNDVRSLVKDINPGPASSSPALLTNGNGILYFTADDGVHGRELWRSNGTAAGTFMVIDLAPGAASADISQLVFANGKIFFVTPGGLYASDGTGANTSLMLAGSGIASLVGSNYAYFTYDDGSHGREVWRSDATPAGTTLITDLQPGSASSSPGTLFPVSSGVNYVASTAADGYRMRYTGGSSTSLVTMGSPPSYPATQYSNLKLVGGTVYWTGLITGSTNYTCLFWAAGPIGSMVNVITGMNAVYGRVGSTLYYFQINSSEGNRLELRGDGGFMKVIETPPSGQPTLPPAVCDANGLFYFVAMNESRTGMALWRSDGTAAGTYSTDPLPVVPSKMSSVNGQLYLTLRDSYVGAEPFHLISTITASNADDSIVIKPNALQQLFDVYINAPITGDATMQLSRQTVAVPTVNGSGGNDTLAIVGLTSNESATFSANGVTVGTFIVPTASIEKYVFDGGGGNDSLTISGAAVELSATQLLSGLSITSGSLNLKGYNITLSYTTSPIGAWNGTGYTGITGLIATGKITSAPGVGVIDSGGVVRIGSVRPGDADVNGRIDGDDYFRIDAGYAGHATGYASGDFDYNGKIDADDYFLIDSNYNKAPAPLIPPMMAAPSTGAAATGAVEPTSALTPAEAHPRKLLDELG